MSQPNPNPYAAPLITAEMVQPSGHHSPIGVWRKGKLLVMHRAAMLPDRCVKSNEPAAGQLKRKLNWHHPAIYLGLLLNLLVYLILALALGQKATIHIGLSERWFSKRRRAIVIGWSLVLAAVALVAGGIASDSEFWPLMVFPGLLLFIVGALWGLYGARMVYPKKIDDHYVWLGGVHPSFLDTLPAWPDGT